MVSQYLFLTLGIVLTLCHRHNPETLKSRKRKAWISTFDISDGTCSIATRYHDTFPLSNGTCLPFPPGGNPDYGDLGEGSRVGCSWGDLSTMTAYELGSCSGPQAWVTTRKGHEDGFCVTLGDLSPSDPTVFWVDVMGKCSGVEPQAVVPSLDGPQVSHHE